MGDKFVIGDIELLIVYGDNIYHVLDTSKEYGTVYTGLYEECLEYCERQEIVYKESIIG